MSPEETIPFLHPQIYCISTELSEECPPVPHISFTYISIIDGTIRGIKFKE
jgi:hypothetical protein